MAEAREGATEIDLGESVLLRQTLNAATAKKSTR